MTTNHQQAIQWAERAIARTQKAIAKASLVPEELNVHIFDGIIITSIPPDRLLPTENTLFMAGWRFYEHTQIPTAEIYEYNHQEAEGVLVQVQVKNNEV